MAQVQQTTVINCSLYHYTYHYLDFFLCDESKGQRQGFGMNFACSSSAANSSPVALTVYIYKQVKQTVYYGRKIVLMNIAHIKLNYLFDRTFDPMSAVFYIHYDDGENVTDNM